MATVVLTNLGSYAAGQWAQSLGVSVATQNYMEAGGGLLGLLAGSYIDGLMYSQSTHNYGPCLDDLTVTSSTEGQPIPIIYGTARVSGFLIWSTTIKETKHTEEIDGGGGSGGGGGDAEITTYTYTVDCAVAVCEGPISGIRRIWADGKLLYDNSDELTSGVYLTDKIESLRTYTGTDAQLPDPLLEYSTGVPDAPAYRGTAYVVFETLQLGSYGNKIPNFTFEVVSSPASAEPSTLVGELAFGTGNGPGYQNLKINAYYADIDGVYIVEMLDANNYNVSYWPTGSDLSVFLRKVTIQGTVDLLTPWWLGASTLSKGRSDKHVIGIPIKKNGFYGVGLINLFLGTYTPILIPAKYGVDASAHAYHLRGNKVYFSAGYGSGGNLCQLFVGDVTTGYVQKLLLPTDNQIYSLDSTESYLYYTKSGKIGRVDLTNLLFDQEWATGAWGVDAAACPFVDDQDRLYYGNAQNVKRVKLTTGAIETLVANYSQTMHVSTYFYHLQFFLDKDYRVLTWWKTDTDSIIGDPLGVGAQWVLGLFGQVCYPLDTMCEELITRVNVPIGDTDMAALAGDNVCGMALTLFTPRDVLDALAGSYDFSIKEEDGKIKAFKFGTGTPVVIDGDAFGAKNG